MKLIVGCGNPDRCDDAAGILVARRLRELGIETLEHSGDGLALLDLWNSSDDVILVDAMVSGAGRGSVSVWDPMTEPVCRMDYRCSTHDFGPAEAIELGRVMDRLPRSIKVYGIEAGGFEPGSEPSPEVMGAVELVAQTILNGSM